MTAHWSIVKLGDVCLTGETVNPARVPDVEFDYVDVSSVSNETFSITGSARLTGSDAPSRARRKIAWRDVIFATVRPTLQRIAQVPAALDGAVCSTGFIVLRAGPKLDAKFLFYALFRPEFMDAMEQLQAGASYPAVTDKQVLNQPIILPSLEEQKRIVAVLDQAFAALDRARALAEANLADLEDLSLSASRAVFDDTDGDRLSLGELCEIYQPKTISAKDLKPDGAYIVFGANGPIGRYDKFNHETSQLLVTCRGATCGSINISEPYSWITGNAMVVRPKDDRISVHYLEQFFRGAMDWGTVITGAAQPQITRQSLAPTLVPVPERDIQDRQASALKDLQNKLSQMENQIEAKLDDLDALRQSLLRKAFAGELT